MLRWLKDDSFKQLYRDARSALLIQAITQVQGACVEAIGTLRSVTRDTTAPASFRVSAARTILEMSNKAVEKEDLVARVETLEKPTARSEGNEWYPDATNRTH